MTTAEYERMIAASRPPDEPNLIDIVIYSWDVRVFSEILDKIEAPPGRLSERLVWALGEIRRLRFKVKCLEQEMGIGQASND